jgi:hypothetical protein
MIVFGLKVTRIYVQIRSETEGYGASKKPENQPFGTLRYPLVSQPERVNANYCISYVCWRCRVNRLTK